MLYGRSGKITHQTLREDLELFLNVEVLFLADNYGISVRWRR